jgi:RNA polymerase sigma factor (sigma-70 family)
MKLLPDDVANSGRRGMRMGRLKRSSGMTDSTVDASGNERAARGSSGTEAEKQFSDFFSRVYPRLYSALLVACRCPGQADEAAQEALARAWRAWAHVSQLEEREGYVFRIAFNVLADHYRRERRRRLIGLRPRSVHDDHASVDAHSALQEAILLLPGRQRAALLLTVLFGYSSEEAATIMGVRPGTVRRMVGQARKRLRTQVYEKE